ncbi:cytochrome P450-like protein [Pholiota conissans]|uniref:Cytochrome P450-like protein n=1 Tax=Pholiota conissans TaxID=109636 RepID=A0A9P6CPW6_9AGAR|nr:cytochrome P450-like protein [Pholiota conissans]
MLPLSVFHASMSDDVYNGYYIPKGTTIIPNVWAMTRDPTRYEDPETFNPSRFLDENNRLNNGTMTYVFGFGQRICPGRYMASATMWLTITTVLSTFNIRPRKDASGNDISLHDIEYSGGLISHVSPFEYSITPRSEKAKQLIVDANNAK